MRIDEALENENVSEMITLGAKGGTEAIAV